MESDKNSITIPYISGDGIGPEIMAAAHHVIDQAVSSAYKKTRTIDWLPCLAGGAAYQSAGDWLPEESIRMLEAHKVSLKGPLTTPVGGGFTSLNVRLRRLLDLYVCLRPVRWFDGLPSPHRSPQGIDLVIFRENTEDLYAGIEYQPGTELHGTFLNAFRSALPDDYKKLPHPDTCGIGIKPVSKAGSERLVRAAIRWALENHRKRVTLVHKGNIMKFTEGAFAGWGYDLAESEFGGKVFTKRCFNELLKEKGEGEAANERESALAQGMLWLDDLIADVAFEQLITYPQQMDVIATTNLNGDYISDAAAALAGGVGISPGANINFESGFGVFEANHGSAEELAGRDMANPSSLILSGEMMLRFIGWHEAADLVRAGVTGAIRAKLVTFDLSKQIDGARTIGTSGFAAAIIDHMSSSFEN